jgi:hypothetical protein
LQYPPKHIVTRGYKATLTFMKGSLFTDLLRSERFSDIHVVLNINNEKITIPAHGVILELRWPSLIAVENEKTFKGESKEITVHCIDKEYIITGIAENVFEILLEYLYTNRIDLEMLRNRYKNEEELLAIIDQLDQITNIFPDFSKRDKRLQLLCLHIRKVIKKEENELPKELSQLDFIEFNFADISNKFADIQLSVQDELIPCHKVILCQRSVYFRTMFEGSFTESTLTEIPMEHGTPDLFHAILFCLYAGSGDEHQATCHSFKMVFRTKYLHKTATDMINFLMEMVALTGVYSLPDIHLASDLELGNLIKEINLSSCIALLEFADTYNSTRFYDKILSLMQKQIKGPELMKTTDYLEAPENIRTDINAKYNINTH